MDGIFNGSNARLITYLSNKTDPLSSCTCKHVEGSIVLQSGLEKAFYTTELNSYRVGIII